MRHLRRTILVLTGVRVWTYSHDRVAKKNAPTMRSTAWSSGVLAIIFRLTSLAILRSKRGVTAFCRFSGGDTLSKAWNRLVKDGMYLLLSCWRRGDRWIRFPNSFTKALEALLRLDDTIGFVRHLRTPPCISNSTRLYFAKKARKIRSISAGDVSWRRGSMSPNKS